MVRIVVIDPELERREVFEREVIDIFDSTVKIYSFDDLKSGVLLSRKTQIDVIFYRYNAKEDQSNLYHIDTEKTDLVFLVDDYSFAVEALRLNVTYYLVLPYSEEEIFQCIRKIEKGLTRRRELAFIMHSININRLKQNESMLIKTTKNFIHVWMHTLNRLEADGSYTYIYLNDKKKILTSNHLKKYEERLIPFDFYRVNKSFLINLHYVRFLTKGKDPRVEMEDGFITEVSRREKKGLRERLEEIASHTF